MEVHDCEVNPDPASSQQPLPLRFHSVHGENIQLSECRTVARRDSSFKCKGLVFSQRPVQVDEYVYIKLLNISKDCEGGLSVGFTENDPASYSGQLPKCALTLRKSPGVWTMCLKKFSAQENSVLFFYFTAAGAVYFGQGTRKRIILRGLNVSANLWAVIDISGRVTGIELLSRTSVTVNVTPQQPASTTTASSSGSHSNSSVSSVLPSSNMDKSQPMRFHSCQKNASFLDNRTMALRNINTSHALVFMEQPMVTNNHVVVHISSCDIHSWSPFTVGLTSCDPSHLTSEDFPETTNEMLDRPEYWVINGVPDTYHSGDAFDFVINSDGVLQYSQNNSEFAPLMYVDNTVNLWLFVELNKSIHSILLEDPQGLKNVDLSRPSTSRVLSLPNTVDFSPVCFHEIHGDSITLTTNRTVAVHDRSHGDGILFMEQPVIIDNQIPVHISACDVEDWRPFVVGFTSCNPSCLTSEDLSAGLGGLLNRSEYWVASGIPVLFVGDVVFNFVVNSNGIAQYSVNDSELSSLLYVDHTVQLWFLMNLNPAINSIRLGDSDSQSEMQEYNICSQDKSPLGHSSKENESPSCSSQSKMQKCDISSQQSAVQNKSPVAQSSKENETPSRSLKNRKSQCVVCYGRKSNTALYRCGHVCMCYPCARKIKNSTSPVCPLCRQFVEDIIKLYT